MNRYFVLKNLETLEAMVTDLLEVAPVNSVVYFENSFFIPKLDQYPNPSTVIEGATAEQIAEIESLSVPQTISKMDFKLQLIAHGISIQSVNNEIAAIEDATFKEVVFVKFNDCEYLERQDPILNQFANQMGIPESLLDSIFKQEGQLNFKK